MPKKSLWLLVFVLSAQLISGCSALRQSIQNQPCALNASQPYDTVHVNPVLHTVSLHWKNPETDQPFKTIQNILEWLESGEDSVIAVTNAGIFEPGLIPTGLYVENGHELRPLNLEDGYGNFFLKPNGVFFINQNQFRIQESSSFHETQPVVDYALQSGPLLLRENQIHPAFTPGSANCRLRSGIGISSDGRPIIAISNGAVNFYDFAIWFRDTAEATDALYLDGAISALFTGESTRSSGETYAGFLVVTTKRE